MTASRGVAGILLAAGYSRRFGTDKLQVELPHGKRVGTQAARNLIKALPMSFVVVRPETDATEFGRLGFRVVRCPDAVRGMGASLACGVRAAADADGYCIALADMPFIASNTFCAVTSEMLARDCIVAAAYKGTRGHPVAFPARYRAALTDLNNDQGARTLIAENRIKLLNVVDAGVLRDVDTPEGLHNLEGHNPANFDEVKRPQ